MVPLPGHGDAVTGEMSFEELEHELRTPLASMRSLSEIIRDHPDLSEEQRRRFVDGILRENERLTRTVERLLSSTALRSGLS
jgi:signal transduction histidine kinase